MCYTVVMEMLVAMKQTIRELREARGLSLRELAAELGISFMAIQHWETNKRMPRADQLRAIARYFSVSMDDIELPQVPDLRRSDNWQES